MTRWLPVGVSYGRTAAAPLGWRAGMAVPAVAFGVLWLRFRGLRLAAPAAAGPGAPAEAAAPPLTVPGATGPPVPGHLPGRFWVRAALVGAVVAVEFCLVFQAALLLHAQDALSTRRAAAALSVFLGGELAGRMDDWPRRHAGPAGAPFSGQIVHNIVRRKEVRCGRVAVTPWQRRAPR